MRRHHCIRLAWIGAVACTGRGGAGAATLDAPHASALIDSVRVFMANVAQGVSQRGPVAWRGYFEDSPAFFMASEGRLVFPSSDSATRGIQGLTRVIAHIELRWGDTLRVDPLAPGLAVVGGPYHEVRIDIQGRRLDEQGYFTGVAEHGRAGWRFRDAHWSVVAPPARVP